VPSFCRYKFVRLHLCTHVQIHAHECLCVCVCVCAYVRVCVHVCVHVWIQNTNLKLNNQLFASHPDKKLLEQNVRLYVELANIKLVMIQYWQIITKYYNIDIKPLMYKNQFKVSHKVTLVIIYLLIKSLHYQLSTHKI